MEWIIGVIILVIPFAGIAGMVRARRNFDRMIEPAEDIKSIEDRSRPGLGERDGTGGFI